MQSPIKTVGANVATSPLKTPPSSSQTLSESNDQISALHASQGQAPSPCLTPLRLHFEVASDSESDVSSDIESPFSYAACDLEDKLSRKLKSAKTGGRRRPPTPTRGKAPTKDSAKAVANHLKAAAVKAKAKAATTTTKACRAAKAAAVEESLPPVEVDAELKAISPSDAATYSTVASVPADAPSEAVTADGIDSSVPYPFAPTESVEIDLSLPSPDCFPLSENIYDILAEEGLDDSSFGTSQEDFGRKSVTSAYEYDSEADLASYPLSPRAPPSPQSSELSYESEIYSVYCSSDSEIELESLDLAGTKYEERRAFNTTKLHKMPPKKIRGGVGRKSTVKCSKKAAREAQYKAHTEVMNQAKARKTAAIEAALPPVEEISILATEAAAPLPIVHTDTAATAETSAEDPTDGIRVIINSEDAIFMMYQHPQLKPPLPAVAPIPESYNSFAILLEMESGSESEAEYESDSDVELDLYDLYGIDAEDSMAFGKAKMQKACPQLHPRSKAAQKRAKAASHKAEDKAVHAAVTRGRNSRESAINAALPPTESFTAAPAAATAKSPPSASKISGDDAAAVSTEKVSVTEDYFSGCEYIQPALPSLPAIPCTENQFAVLEEVYESPAGSKPSSPEGWFIRSFRFVGGIVARVLAVTKTLVWAGKQLLRRR